MPDPANVGGGTCPYCGASGSVPIEDAWSCQNCKREYPTLAYKCRRPGCWGSVYLNDYCAQHAADAKDDKAS